MAKKHHRKKNRVNKLVEQESTTAKDEEQSKKSSQKNYDHLKDWSFWKKALFNEKTLIILLILIPIILSSYFRAYPFDLPITDQWAEDGFRQQIRANVASQIQAQYPNLPEQERNKFINEQVNQVFAEQEDQLQQQIELTSQAYKDELQDENGQTYLLAIDPYLWHTYAKQYEENGFFGNEITEDGEKRFNLRNGRIGEIASFKMTSFVIIIIQRIGSIFDSDFSLLKAAFLMPLLIIALAIIPAFFLGRKIGGNVGGFVAGLIIALNTALLGRTPAGFSDTDAFIILFPLLLVWIYFEAFTSKNLKVKIGLTILNGFIWSIFFRIWSTGWHVLTILFGVSFIYFVYTTIRDWKSISTFDVKKILKTTSATTTLIVLLLLCSSMFFTGTLSIISNKNNSFADATATVVNLAILFPFQSVNAKEVASGDNIWPNVLTTVAELNAGSRNQIINSLGGKEFFWIGMLGVILTFFLKNQDGGIEIRYASLLLIWFVGLSIASLQASRFIALLAAPFAIAFGAAFGIVWTQGSKLVKRYLSLNGLFVKGIVIVLLLFLFYTPMVNAHRISLSEVPSMNDGWYDTLTTIKEDSAESGDAIITSWWDFGHWFVNVAERRVTFDGGNQGKRIYWVGKSLISTDVEENKAILRMLNCGQNQGYERIREYKGESFAASELINTIIYETRSEARERLLANGLTEEQTSDVLSLTHCSDEELIDQYYIASEDMIGKAAVWGHFGSWDFTRADIYNTAINSNNAQNAIDTIASRHELDQETAQRLYFEAISLTSNRQVDAWISPWPSYVTTRPVSCNFDNVTVSCPVGRTLGTQQGANIVLDGVAVNINNPEEDAVIQISTYVNGQVAGSEQVKPQIISVDNGQGFSTYNTNDGTFPYEVVLVEENGNYRALIADPLLARSAFSMMFYFNGKYLDGYEKISDITTFNGQQVIVYKVDLTNGDQS